MIIYLVESPRGLTCENMLNAQVQADQTDDGSG